MLSSSLANHILRAIQALFGIIVLGLAITLIRGHHWGSFPSSLGFTAFVGGITILAALIGVCATWVTFLAGAVGYLFDSVVALVDIAGGIVLAINLKGVKCSATSSFENAVKLARNDLFNGGVRMIEGEEWPWVAAEYSDDPNKLADVIIGHCMESQAAMVFMFLAAAALVVSALVGFVRARKGV